MSFPKSQLACVNCGHPQFRRVTTTTRKGRIPHTENRDGRMWHILDCAQCGTRHELQTGYAEFKQLVEVLFDPNPHKLISKEKKDAGQGND